MILKNISGLNVAYNRTTIPTVSAGSNTIHAYFIKLIMHIINIEIFFQMTSKCLTMQRMSNMLNISSHSCIIRPHRSRSAAAYSRQTFPWTIRLSVRTYVHVYVHASVGLPVHCGKMVDRIRMSFGIIRWTGPGMRQVVGFGDRSTGRGILGGEFRACHCNQWGLYGVRV